ALGASAPPICAVGAELKNTVCLTRGERAYLSPHVGDLESLETRAFFEEVMDKLAALLGVTPEIVAHDLHPDYASTRWALASHLTGEAVQHHHAHIASCLADNGHFAPVLGIAFDGTGCGPAGDLWGGEILYADMIGFQRLAHLRPLALPGGEAAIREPWRLAVAALVDAGLPLDRLAGIPIGRRQTVARLCEKAPRATGAGRWFDAVAALSGLCERVSYEGQAAIELEAIADRECDQAYPFAFGESVPAPIDLRPTVSAIDADLRSSTPISAIAGRFHRTLSEIVRAAVRRFAPRLGVSKVALSGGCFQNRILTETTKALLEADGFEVLIHHRVPPNDGGIALGQAAVAAHRWQQRQNGSSHVSRHSG
ncbi:MAG TPA: carbamoyltransferase HypF, partial [Polyangiaceae bacterium]